MLLGGYCASVAMNLGHGLPNSVTKN